MVQLPRSKINQLFGSNRLLSCIYFSIPTTILTLKYPNHSYLFLYKTKDRYSIFPMNIDPFNLF